jgi:hypothetical protein
MNQKYIRGALKDSGESSRNLWLQYSWWLLIVGDDHFCGHDEAAKGRRYLGRPPNASTRPSDAPELAREASGKAGGLPPNIRDEPRRNLCPPGQDEDSPVI